MHLGAKAASGVFAGKFAGIVKHTIGQRSKYLYTCLHRQSLINNSRRCIKPEGFGSGSVHPPLVLNPHFCKTMVWYLHEGFVDMSQSYRWDSKCTKLIGDLFTILRSKNLERTLVHL